VLLWRLVEAGEMGPEGGRWGGFYVRQGAFIGTPLHVLSKQNLLPDLPNAPKYKAQQKRNYQFDS
jgi:hypothetical protein